MESVGSLRDHGEGEPDGLALADEQDVLKVLRGFVMDGLVEVWELAEPRLQLQVAPHPRTDDESLRCYWFKLTDGGRDAWRVGEAELSAYYGS